MEFVYTCPARDCDFSVKIESQNEAWAIEKIMEVSLCHAHAKTTPLTPEDIRSVVVANGNRPGGTVCEGILSSRK